MKALSLLQLVQRQYPYPDAICSHFRGHSGKKDQRVKKYCSYERKDILLFRETKTIYLLLIMTTNNDTDEETFEEQGKG